MIKKCNKCGVEKQFDLFGKSKANKFGLKTLCKKCEAEKAGEYRNKNYEKSKQLQVKSYWKNREERLIGMKNYQTENAEALKSKRIGNKDKIAKMEAKRYIENRDEMLAKRKEWKRSNSGTVTAMTAKRRALKLHATPEWLTKEHHKQIVKFYKDAKEMSIKMGEKYEVDHIFPLVTKIACGLHVPWNLQVIPARINRFKNNKILDVSSIV